LHELSRKYPCIHALGKPSFPSLSSDSSDHRLPASHLRTQVLATPPSGFIAAFNNTACQAVLPSFALPPLPTKADDPSESKKDEDG
jgi:hypothetical protein